MMIKDVGSNRVNFMLGDKSSCDKPPLTMTAYPPGNGPYDRWEVTTSTGEVLISGTSFPIDQDKVHEP
jgi:hypothetical protein